MTQRILKVNKLIKQEVGKIILSEINFPAGIMVTVMKAEVKAEPEEAPKSEKLSMIEEKLAKAIEDLIVDGGAIAEVKPVVRVAEVPAPVHLADVTTYGAHLPEVWGCCSISGFS